MDTNMNTKNKRNRKKNWQKTNSYENGNLSSSQATCSFRYVGDYIVLLTNRPEERSIKVAHEIHSNFVQHSQGLNFIHELLTSSVLQF